MKTDRPAECGRCIYHSCTLTGNAAKYCLVRYLILESLATQKKGGAVCARTEKA